jgi:hypothetical protein
LLEHRALKAGDLSGMTAQPTVYGQDDPILLRAASAEDSPASASRVIGPSGTMVMGPEKSAAERGASGATADHGHHAVCYFSTPARMRNCFPGPQAHIFQCKGELRLEASALVFISPWRTHVVIPLREICNVSIGQFQMWTTPWVMKYERLNFLAVTFAAGSERRTVHLTPVAEGAHSAAQANALVAEWFELIRTATATSTGAVPPASEPAQVTVSAQPSWNRKGIPLCGGLLASWALLLWRTTTTTTNAPDLITILLFLAMVLMLIGCGWYALGFLQANRAIKLGELDAVTCDEPPGEVAGSGGNFSGPGGNSQRPFWWTMSAWVFIAIGLVSVVDTLASIYSRPLNPVLSPALAHFFAGVALLTLSRRWRVVALVALTLSGVAGAFIGIAIAVSPERGTVQVPMLDAAIPVLKEPYLGAVAAVFLGLLIFWPGYLLMSRKGKKLFRLARQK